MELEKEEEDFKELTTFDINIKTGEINSKEVTVNYK